MIKIKAEMTINRPSDQVFSYISNFENNPKWQAGMQEAHFTSEGPLQVGSTYAQVAKFLGRRIESNFEVIAYEPHQMVKAMSTGGSFPITFTRTVKPIENNEDGTPNTKVEAIVEGDATGFFKLAEPLLARMVQRSVNADYANLKKILER